MFLEITSGNITTLLGYVKGLITDLSPLLLLVVAVFLGLIIFWALVDAIKR